MRPISAEEAERENRITAVHHEMTKGGERRFRLSAPDGTRYIRTERPTAAGGEWQEAHFHRNVKETYIVQHGWIAFAELRRGNLAVRVLGEGDIVTTEARIPHNVYMAAGAVIHTVKHGIGTGEDKEPHAELTALCRTLSDEDTIRARAAADNSQATAYDENYRHFDSMIWQIPGWSTAVFLGAAAVVGQANVEAIAKTMPMYSVKSLLTGFLAVVFLFLLSSTQMLYRFRVHQAPLKRKRTSWWSSASTHLQVFTTAQAFVVLHLALGAASVPPQISGPVCVGLFAILSTGREYLLRRSKR